MSVILVNKPLVEAMFELQWELQESPLGFIDPNYQILIGRFFDRIQEDYPFYEHLWPSAIPEGMTAGLVQHRFRKGENQFPIVQLGLGVLTFNSTEDYTWESFKNGVVKAVQLLCNSYPKKNDLKIKSVSLRYIDAIDINLEKNSIYAFLTEKLKIKFLLDESLFKNSKLINNPIELKLNLIFNCEQPKGLMAFNIGKGQREQKDAIILEHFINSFNEDIPIFPDGTEQWLTEAHDVAHNWFFALIDGELMESFR